jgi:O-antigen/teichoic acid export membrane protein
MIKKFLNDSLIYTLPSILSKALSIVLLPLYTKLLTKVDYGIIDILNISGVVLGYLVTLEISQAVARYSSELNDHDRTRYSSSALCFIIINSFVVLLVVILFKEHLSRILLENSDSYKIVILFVLSFIANQIYLILYNQLRWELKAKQAATLSLIQLLLQPIFQILFLFYFHFGVSSVFLSILFTKSILIVIAYSLQKDRFTLYLSKEVLIELLTIIYMDSSG